VSSIPFYSLFKLVFFLWLSLPQTEGSTYLFNTLLAPTFHEHERDIDAFLSSLKSRMSGAILDLLTWAWGKARGALDVSLNRTDKSFADQPRS
jgi:receptor expression-enhancing protein 1/2/3/4